jgi:hypothetical protein
VALPPRVPLDSDPFIISLMPRGVNHWDDDTYALHLPLAHVPGGGAVGAG